MTKKRMMICSLAALLPLSALAAETGDEKSLFVGANLTDGNSETESVNAELKIGKKKDNSECLFFCELGLW